MATFADTPAASRGKISTKSTDNHEEVILIEKNMDYANGENWKLGTGWLVGIDYVKVDESLITDFAARMQEVNPNLRVPESPQDLIDMIGKGIDKRRRDLARASGLPSPGESASEPSRSIPLNEPDDARGA